MLTGKRRQESDYTVSWRITRLKSLAPCTYIGNCVGRRMRQNERQCFTPFWYLPLLHPNSHKKPSLLSYRSFLFVPGNFEDLLSFQYELLQTYFLFSQFKRIYRCFKTNKHSDCLLLLSCRPISSELSTSKGLGSVSLLLKHVNKVEGILYLF